MGGWKLDSMMIALGKILILLGSLFIVVGIGLLLGPKIPFLGKLPGDIHFKKGNVEVYIPLATSILLSLLLSGILWALNHAGKR